MSEEPLEGILRIRIGWRQAGGGVAEKETSWDDWRSLREEEVFIQN